MSDEKEREFVKIYKDIALDPRLSMQARALYATMRAHLLKRAQRQVAISLATLRKESGWGGKETLYLYLDELIAAGLVISHKGRPTQATVYEMTDQISEGFVGRRKIKKNHLSLPAHILGHTGGQRTDHPCDQVVDHPCDKDGDQTGGQRKEISVDHPCDQVVDHPCDQVVDHPCGQLLKEEKELERNYPPHLVPYIATIREEETAPLALADPPPAPSGTRGGLPVDPPTRRRSVSWRNPETGRVVTAINEQGGICSDLPPTVVTPVVAPEPAKPLTESQAAVDAWCTAMGINWRKITKTEMGLLNKHLKEMREVGVTSVELPDLIAFHRRTRPWAYQSGTPSAKQVATAIPDWEAEKEKPASRRYPDWIDEMAKTVI